MPGDVIGERDEKYRKLREFLYVDLQRVRSYYAQSNRGVIDSILSRETGSREVDVQARIFGIGASGGGSLERAREESRSLQDLSYVIFEELFDDAGLISEIDETIEDASLWASGQVYDSLAEGSIIRYTGLIQVLDPQFIMARIEQLRRLTRGIAGAQVGKVTPKPSSPPSRKGGHTRAATVAETADAARERRKEEILSELLEEGSLAQYKDIADTIGAFTNDQISVRVFPCGRDHADYHFAGTLLSRSEYIQEEREALFGRYGVYLDDWTVVMQIARIPAETPPQSPDFTRSLIKENGIIDRAALEQMVIDLIGDWEQKGLSEGVRYPAVSTTILAIYREFG
jgi:hypothetical protein